MRNEEGFTAIHLASYKGNYVIVISYCYLIRRYRISSSDIDIYFHFPQSILIICLILIDHYHFYYLINIASLDF